MPNTSISGLVSGLDTSTIISQLMQLEARPQSLLKSKLSTQQKVVGALQALNTKLASLTTKAADLAKSTAWNPTRATSSNDKVAVTAAAAAPGSVTLDVNAVATATKNVYATASAATSAGAAGSTVTISFADPTKSAVTLSAGDGSLQSIAAAINGSATAGLQAVLVRAGGTDAAPTYQLVVTSKTTGSTSGFTIDDGSGSFLGGTTSASSAGSDASITVNGAQMTQASNTFRGLMPGVDVTLQPGATGSATIGVERDVQSLSDSMKAMVDSVNAVLDEAGKQTTYDANTKTAGLLAGDSTVRDVRNRLLESVTTGVGGRSLATVGIQVDRYGKLTFDKGKFESAYAADPTATQEMVAGKDADTATGTAAVDGFADILERVGKGLSDSFDGTVTLSIKSHQTGIKGIEDDIADWDFRLAARQTTLQRQYTALETALGQLQSQSSWLAGQISSLPKMSNG